MGFQVFRAFADKPQKPLADSTVSYLHRQNIKRTAETALFSYHHLSIYFYRFTIIQARKLFTLSRKPLYYHENSLSVSVIIQAVSVFVYGFCLRVYTIRQNNPRTKVRTLANVKMPLKAHGNNVTLESM